MNEGGSVRCISGIVFAEFLGVDNFHKENHAVILGAMGQAEEVPVLHIIIVLM